jgi:selenocysteine lyase/cysteine desulfurase
LDYKDLESKFNSKTKLICIGWASNLFGTVNDIKKIKDLIKGSSAMLLVDSVHYAPHFDINIDDLGCDILLCSAYKFYGPHIGVLYCREGLLDSLPIDSLRSQKQTAPDIIETGTKNHAALAGVLAAINFMSSLGEGGDLASKIKSGKKKVESYERSLAQTLWDGLQKINGIQVFGPDFKNVQRAPTISFIHDKYDSAKVCEVLAFENIYAMSGHFYAIKAVEVLGLEHKGGVVRMGMAVYNTMDEVKRTLSILKNM